MQKTVILEQRSNTHKLDANEVVVENVTEDILSLKISGSGVVTHGEHGTLKTESENVVKYVQQELNPVSKKMQAAFD